MELDYILAEKTMGFSQTTRTHAHLICVNKNNLCFSIVGVSADDRTKVTFLGPEIHNLS